MPLVVSLAGVSVIYCLMVLFAMEEKEHGAGPLKLVWLGFLCGLAILGYQMLHLYFWYDGGAYWRCGTIFLELLPRGILELFPNLFEGELALRNNMHRAAAERAGILAILQPRVDPHQHSDRLPVDCLLPARSPPARPPRAPATHRIRPPCSCCCCCWPRPPTAAIEPGRALEAGEPRDVLVGFRADAPPFSSIKRVGEEERYEGYLVDLCNRIFHARPGRTLPDGQDPGHLGGPLRPPRARRGGALAARPADRRREDRSPLRPGHAALRLRKRRAGRRAAHGRIFSPIVFVTGVSYVERSNGGTGTTVLGFVSGTTTRKVVLQACERDAFRERATLGTQSDADACPDAVRPSDLENAR